MNAHTYSNVIRERVHSTDPFGGERGLDCGIQREGHRPKEERPEAVRPRRLAVI
jgi:hypothetical protein